MIVMGHESYGEIKEIGNGYIEVGKYCSIASEVVAVTVGHNCDWVTTYPFPARQMRRKYPEGKKVEGHPTRHDIFIGSDVWLGFGAKIIAPAVIGHGAVVGAFSVIRGFVEAYAIVFGNPIMTYGKRFSDEIINQLLKIKWWDWPDEKVKENIHLLCSNRVKEFVDAHSEISEERVCTLDDRTCEALPPKDLC